MAVLRRGCRTARSVRLDEEALKARLEATGMSRSEAIRKALIETADRPRNREALSREVAALEADAQDRRVGGPP